MDTRPESRPSPHVRISGEDRWDTWWVVPLAILLVSAVLVAAAVIVQGPGADSSSPAAGQTASTPAGAQQSP